MPEVYTLLYAVYKYTIWQRGECALIHSNIPLNNITNTPYGVQAGYGRAALRGTSSGLNATAAATMNFGTSVGRGSSKVPPFSVGAPRS